MCATAIKLLDHVIEDGIGLKLAHEGYQSGCPRSYCRVCECHWRMINVQIHKCWTKEGGKFTVNLAVYVPEVSKALCLAAGSKPPKDQPIDLTKPDLWPSTFRDRLGRLATGKDKWWRISRGTPADPLAKELLQAWREYANSWFERYSSIRSVFEAAKASRALWHAAVLSVALGERECVSLWLAQLLATRPDASSQETIIRWAVKEGVLDETAVGKLKHGMMQHVDKMIETVADAFGTTVEALRVARPSDSTYPLFG